MRYTLIVAFGNRSGAGGYQEGYAPMAMPNVQNAKCPDCGRLWLVDELDIVAVLIARPVDSVTRVINGNGCRAVGTTCLNQGDADILNPETVADIVSIMVGVDTVDGFVFDEESAFGLFD